MRPNHTKQRLREGHTVIGGWNCSSDPMLAEAVADCGLDFLVIDTEHAAQSALSLQANLMAMKDTPTTPVVRVLWNDFVRVKQALDYGAQGIVFPWVNSVEEARQAVTATRYPPHGVRGFGPIRAHRYADSNLDYYEHAADNTLVFCQVETQRALDSAEAIAALDGVDALLIGPADLSIDLGVPHQWTCDTFLAAVRRLRQITDAAGKAFGVITSGVDYAVRWVDEGARAIITGADRALLKMATLAARDTVREAIAKREA